MLLILILMRWLLDMLFVRLNFLSLQNVFILLFNFFRIMRPLLRTVVVTAGVCLMRNAWKEDQHPSFINFISTFLSANSFRLNFVPIAPVIGSFCVFPLFVFFFFFCSFQITVQRWNMRSFLIGLYIQLWGFVCGLHFCDKLGLQQCCSNLQQVLGCCYGVIDWEYACLSG